MNEDDLIRFNAELNRIYDAEEKAMDEKQDQQIEQVIAALNRFAGAHERIAESMDRAATALTLIAAIRSGAGFP